MNIKNEGLRILNNIILNKKIENSILDMNLLGTRYPEVTLVDYPTMDDKLSNEELKSSDRTKQEERTIESVKIW